MDDAASAAHNRDDVVASVVMEVVGAHQGIAVDDAVTRAGAALGHDPDDPVARRATERAVRALVDDSDLVLLAPDRVVAPRALLAGAVLTHRLTAAELAGEHLSLACDLLPFAYCDDLLTEAGNPLDLMGLDDGLPAFVGDRGWLDGWQPDDLIAVALGDDGRLALSAARVDPHAPLADAVTDRVRAAYARERADPHLPALVDDIFFAVLLEDPAVFTTPGPPLSELLTRAGLDHRGPLVAHESTVWQHQARADRRRRVAEVAGDEPELVDRIVRVLDIADLASGAITVDVALGALDDALLQQALTALDDVDVLAIVSGELLRTSDLVDQRAVTDGFVRALVGAAAEPHHRAIARYLAALDAQLAGDAGAALEHLAEAHRADATYTPSTDLFAYYASTMGDRGAAEQRWSSCPGSPVIRTELELLRRLPPEPTLTERVPWIQRKVIGFLERSEHAREELAEVAFARAVDPSDEALLRATLDDPLVFDAVVHEAGWFARFLTTMGPLLPDDERTLLQRWTECERVLVEVTALADDGGLHLRVDRDRGDGALAPEVHVPSPTGRSHGGDPLTIGSVVCGRIVPDGEGRRILPGWFVVPPDVEDDVREILSERDAIAVALIASELDARDRAPGGAIDLRDHLRVIDR